MNGLLTVSGLARLRVALVLLKTAQNDMSNSLNKTLLPMIIQWYACCNHAMLSCLITHGQHSMHHCYASRSLPL